MFKIVTVLMLLPCIAAAQDILFTDDFSDGVADGWIELATGAQYEVVNECYCITAGAGVEYGSTFNADQSTGMSTANYSIYAQFKVQSPTHGALLFVRTDHTVETGYFLYLRVYQNMVRIGRQDPMTWVNLAEDSYTFAYDEMYWARFMVVGNGLWGKVWQGEFTAEPLDWLIYAEDTTYTDPGFFGLGAANLASQTGIDAEFDNVLVTQQYDAMEASTWATIKATVKH